MPLDSGRRLGNYEILDLIGAGGMGEVYRARDSKLERDVAIKILPEELARDGERLARFEREAKLLASVNHPAIATLHGLEDFEGTRFIVMELVEGETLADRLARGPLSIEDTTALFVQIADALEAAHDRGVIHRDLKPGNIMITRDDRIKVLDFGLAKAWQGDAPEDDVSQSPTLTRGSVVGEIMGTAAYMSPEQARGKPVDKRTDLWAFGVVLYEAMTGKRLFRGEDVSETLAFVLTKEVDWGALPASTQPSVRRLLRRTVERDRRRRLADAADARLDLEEGTSSDENEAKVASRPFGWRWGAGIALGAAAAGLVAWLGARPEAGTLARLTIVTPPSEPVYLADPPLAITPDGSSIIYFVTIDGGGELRLRQLDTDEPTTLVTSPRHALHAPFVSADGEWVGFVDSDELKQVSIHGGAPTTICSVPGPVSGASWGDDDRIVFAVPNRGLFVVPASGGDAELLLATDNVSGRPHRPQVLPGGDVLFETSPGPGSQAREIEVFSVANNSRTVLVESGSSPRYVPTGHIIYSAEGRLQAIPFDVDRLEVTGGPRALSEDAEEFAISRNGTMAYLPHAFKSTSERRLVWVDHDGGREVLDDPPDGYFDVAVSPDGETLAVNLLSTDGVNIRDIWIYDVARGSRTRLTFDSSEHPIWTPDGRRLTFSIRTNGIYWQAADGSDDAELLVADARRPESWTPDGSVLAFTKQAPETGTDIWTVSPGAEPMPLIQTVHNEEGATFSPDGRWLAYVSDETGVRQVYVRPYPGPGGKVAISIGGGRAPVWSSDGSSIFFRSNDSSRMQVVSIDTAVGLEPGVPTTLFGDAYFSVGGGDPHYHVSTDGKRFLMIDEGGAAGTPANQINVVLNWFSELERLAPTP